MTFERVLLSKSTFNCKYLDIPTSLGVCGIDLVVLLDQVTGKPQLTDMFWTLFIDFHNFMENP